MTKEQKEEVIELINQLNDKQLKEFILYLREIANNQEPAFACPLKVFR